MSGAEVVLGVVAGGAGLVSLAIQLQESVKKLKSFYKSVKHADERLGNLIYDLESTTLLLKELELELEAADNEEELIGRCVVHYRRCATKLQETSTQITASMHKSPKVGRLSWAMNERDLEQLWLKLERARNQLQLAMQLLARREARKMHTNMLVLLSNATMTKCPQQTLAEAPKHRVSSSFRPTVRKYHDRPCWRGRFRTWFTATIWDVIVRHTNGSWTVLLRMQTLRPFNVKAYRFCKHGDIGGLQQMIDTKQISFTDTFDGATENEVRPRTLLSFAASYGQLALCEWLFRQALWPDHLKCLHPVDWRYGQRVNAYRLFIESVESDVDLDKEVLTGFWPGVDEECLDIVSRNQGSPFHTRSIEDRLEMASEMIATTPTPWLNAIGILASDVRLATVQAAGGWTALHYVTMQIFRLVYFRQSTSEWVKLGVQLLEAGADASAVATSPSWEVNQPSSPLQCIFMRVPNIRSLLNGLKVWLAMLQSAGIDLIAFWSRERLLWDKLNLEDEGYLLNAHSSDNIGPFRSRTFLKRLISNEQSHLWRIICRDHVTVQTYKLRLPGSYPNSPLVPNIIAWPPREHEQTEGPWESVSTSLLHGELYDAETCTLQEEEQNEDREKLVNSAQDDASFAFLIERRISFRDSSRRRSASVSVTRRPQDKSIWAKRYQWVPSRLRTGNWNDTAQTTSIFEERDWTLNSFLGDIQDCQEDVDYLIDRELDQAKPPHTGRPGCPWGCDKVQLEKLAVPESCYENHPKVRKGYEPWST